jgi:hypothetical protein
LVELANPELPPLIAPSLKLGEPYQKSSNPPTKTAKSAQSESLAYSLAIEVAAVAFLQVPEASERQFPVQGLLFANGILFLLFI